MKSLRRTNAIDFTEISDDDSYYSAGETSDDMINDNLAQPNLGADKSFHMPDPLSSFISMQQHLSSIDIKVSDRSKISPILSFDDEDFNLEKLNRPFGPKNGSSRVKQETIGCVIINIAHAAHYKEVASEYFNTNKRFIAWNEIPYTPKTLPKFDSNKDKIDATKIPDPSKSSTSDSSTNVSDFPLMVHSFYKDAYNSYKTQIRFVHFASPSADKLDTIRNARKEIPNARILFHYVGYGYPDPDDGCIFTCEGKNSSMVKYKVEKLMDYIKPPSIFIFDCNKAGLLFTALINHARQNLYDDDDKNSNNNSNNSSKQQNENHNFLHNQASWRDWYCLCSSMNESNLPTNSKLPRDFLTSCLLSPLQISVLCHIIRYYNTTPEFGPEPFEYVKRNFTKFNNGKINELVEILHTIADSIASELVKPYVFSQIFRGDSFVSSLFYNFMLAQYLLRPYGIHPISFPFIPDAAGNHQLWNEWASTLDTLITSTLSPLPSFTTNLFCRVSTIFNTLTDSLYNKTSILPASNSNSITQAILTLMCHAVLLNNNNNKKGNGEFSKDGNRSVNQNLSLIQTSSSSNYYYSLEASTSNLISSSKLKTKQKNLQLNSNFRGDDLNNSANFDLTSDERISYNAINQLAEFASKSKQNRESLARSIHFGLLFKKLLKYLNDGTSSNLNAISNTVKFDTNHPKIIKKDEFHALCYLIISLLQTDMNLFLEIKSDYDFSKLPLLLFDKSFNQVTLTYIAVILASTVSYVNSVKILCSSHDFLLKLKESIPSFSPQLLAWTLILLKKTFDATSIDEDNFHKDSIHMQVAACILHEDCLCRAATISSLPCFMQQKNSKNQNQNQMNFTNQPNQMNFMSQTNQMNQSNQMNFMNQMDQNHNFDNSFNNFQMNQMNISPSSASSTIEFEDENPVNMTLFFIPFPCFSDISYLVRFQYLLFIIRFLTASRSLYERIMGSPTSSPSNLAIQPSGSAPNTGPPPNSLLQQQTQPTVNQSIKGVITDLRSKIHEMKNIDISSFKSIIAEWMCLAKSATISGSLSKGSDMINISSSSSSFHNSFPNSSSIANSFSRNSDSLSFDSISNAMNFEYGITNFENYAKIVDLVCKRDDVKIRMYAMSLFLLDYYSKDPHPSIRSIASKAKIFFDNESNKQSNITPSSSSNTAATPNSTNSNNDKNSAYNVVNYNEMYTKNQTPVRTSNSSKQEQTSAAGKAKGNFFSHFNMFQTKLQQQETQANQNTAINVSTNSSNQTDTSYVSVSSSPIYPSPISNQLAKGTASSLQNSAGLHSNSDPASNSSSSSATTNQNANINAKISTTAANLSSTYFLENYMQEINSLQREEEMNEYCDSSQSCTFFESDSQALFNISLKKIAKSGQWFINDSEEEAENSPTHSKIRRKSMRFSNLGNIDVPGISIQLRAQTKYLSLIRNSNYDTITSPTLISHDSESMNLAVSTKDHSVYLLDESLSIINQIQGGDSDISDLKFINNFYNNFNIDDHKTFKNPITRNITESSSCDINISDITINKSNKSSNAKSSSSEVPQNSKSILAFASCDGCLRIWDVRNNQPCLLWRASSSFNDDRTPLFFTSSDIEQQDTNNYQSHIVTGRGSDEICVWDLMTQKLVCEYSTTSPVREYNKQVSAMTVHPNYESVVIIGYTNGLITSIDTRAPARTVSTNSTSNSSALSNVFLNFSLPGEKIVRLCKNTNGGDFLYAATSKGNAVVWNTTNGIITTSYLSRKYGITSFDVHQMLPLIAYSNKTQAPMIASCQGKLLLEMNAPSAPANSLVIFHPIFPIVTFASNTGELTSYNILVSN